MMTYGLVVMWFLLMFATIQNQGADPWLISSGMIVLVAAILVVHGQRLAYLRIGDYAVLATKEAYDDDTTDQDPERPKRPEQ